MGQAGGVYLNFALWAVALVPGWLVVKEFGVTGGDKKVEREARREGERQASIAAVSRKSDSVEA